MQQVAARVTSIGRYDPLPVFNRLTLAAPGLAANLRPGQFLLASTDIEYVRRPLFPIALDGEGFSLLLPSDGPLRGLVPGDALDCIGPLGKGFPLPGAAHNLLMLAQSEGFGVSREQNGVTFLSALIAHALEARKRVVLIHEAPTASGLFPARGLPLDVELRIATLDGSRGHAGSGLDLMVEPAHWADQVYAVGQVEWYGALVGALEVHRLRVGEGLAWGLIAPALMPCGIGVCGGCAVVTPSGYRFPCTEGPIFDLTRV
jgi:dihydroorotate dehydrogenase electron transfer subunit